MKMAIVRISVLFTLFVLIRADSAPERDDHLPEPGRFQVHISPGPEKYSRIEVGTFFWLGCQLSDEGHVWWMRNGKNLTTPEDKKPSTDWPLTPAKIEDSGEYVCRAESDDGISISEKIQVTVIDSTRISAENGGRVKCGSPATLWCGIGGNPKREDLKWEKVGYPEKSESLKGRTRISPYNESSFEMLLKFDKVNHGDNGTYECTGKNKNGTVISSKIPLVVVDVPEVKIDSIEPVGTDSIYLHWTVNYHNEPVSEYIIEYMLENGGEWIRESEIIDTKNSSVVSKNLAPHSGYRFRITAINSVGMSTPAYANLITTLEKDPVYTPKISLSKKTNTSITIKVSGPPADLKEILYYYKIEVTQGNNVKWSNETDADHIESITIEPLEPDTNYAITVAPCNSYTKRCYTWSPEYEVQTLGENSENSSTDLHSAWVNLVAVNIVSLYFSVKYLIR